VKSGGAHALTLAIEPDANVPLTYPLLPPKRIAAVCLKRPKLVLNPVGKQAGDAVFPCPLVSGGAGRNPAPD